MKRIIFIIMLAALLTTGLDADEKKNDPSQLFYSANGLYEKREYEKALEDYSKIIEMSLASSSLYYNIGNAYFKLGKLGYAILFYERSKRMSPQDADLKSNLAYAKSLVGNPAFQGADPIYVVSLIKRPFEDFNINAMTISALALYIIFILLQALFIVNRVIAKKLRLVMAGLLVLFILNITALAIRYYDQVMLKIGVTVQKTADVKYEPIDKSTTFYKLQEGDQIRVLKARNGWRQIERADGKIGWVKSDSVEII